MKLCKEAEEVVTLLCKKSNMRDFLKNEIFVKNFMNGWKKVMTDQEREIIQDLDECGFTEIFEYFKNITNMWKPPTKKMGLLERRGPIEHHEYCNIDGKRKRLRMFKIFPPRLNTNVVDSQCLTDQNLGILSHRIMPEDVIINCSQDSKIPKPPEGKKYSLKNITK